MRRTAFVYCIVMTAALAVAGCTVPPQRPDAGRLLVAQDRQRDTETARRENARAADLIQQASYADAEAVLQGALEADTMYGPAHNNLGKVYYHQDRYYQAAWQFEYAAKLMPDQAEPRNNLGLIFESIGKLDQAVDAYARAAELAPMNTQIAGNLARARIRRGDRGPEIRDLLQLIVLKDERPEWIAWARDKLHLLDHTPGNTPAPGSIAPGSGRLRTGDAPGS
jgi:Tfp pilus assembly protein PilF